MISDVVLSPSQEAACNAFREFLADPKARVFLLSGFAGSGKSFLVKHLVGVTREEHALLRQLVPGTPEPKFIFTATTNKAASVLEEISGTRVGEGFTIHKMLGLTIKTNYKTGQKFIEQTKRPMKSLANTILVIDEASMINRPLLKIIDDITAKIPGCKILFVGDSYQLPPVKEDVCPIFGMKEHAHFLTDIQRQAADSPIISYAHHFREIVDDENLPWPEVPHDGDNILYYEDEAEFLRTMKDTFRLYDDQSNVKMVKALAWTNNRVRDLNKIIRSELGYNDKYDVAVGETVTANNAIIESQDVKAPTDSVWRVDSMVPGRLEDIPGQHLVLQSLDARAAPDAYIKVFQPDSWPKANALAKQYAKDRDWAAFYRIKDGWADMRSIYAQTVHKSQGSTYMECFIDINDIAKNNKWYEVARLMYVAITRAKMRVHIFGELPERYTRMSRQTAMEKFDAASKAKDVNVPPATPTESDTVGKTRSVADVLGDFV
jgi:hypothetical protein